MEKLATPHEIHIGLGEHGERGYLMPSLDHPNKYMYALDWPQNEDAWLTKRRREMPMSRGEREQFGVNQRTNTTDYAPLKDWKKLWGKEDGKTALFVSAGPSIPESSAEIQRLAKRDDTFVIGINRALRAVPLDYYFILDRWGRADWFVDGPFDKTTLIASTTVNYFHPPMFKKVYWCEHWHVEPYANVTGIGTDLGLTITDAMMCAYKMGASRILLYGCDYSCTLEKDDKGYKIMQYYFDSPWTVERENRPPQYRGHVPFEGIHDKLVLASREHVLYATYTKCMCMMLENAGVEVYNRTPRGMLFHRWDEEPKWDEEGECHGRGTSAGLYESAGSAGGRLRIAKR